MSTRTYTSSTDTGREALRERVAIELAEWDRRDPATGVPHYGIWDALSERLRDLTRQEADHILALLPDAAA